VKKSIYAVALALLVTSAQVYAENKGGIFVEPMLTYEKGDADVDLPSPFGSTDSTIKGFGVGARVGIHVYESIFLGMDGRYSRPTYKNSDTDIDADATAYNFGPVVGIQMPTDLGIRLWAGYIMAAGMDPEKDQNIDLKFKDGTGYRIGAGIKLSSVSLNLEYQQISYDKTDVQSAGPFSGQTNSITQDSNSYVFSVSFPISL
jgi:opacity protein-like surface antigen